MEMSGFRPESHVAQQSRRDKLRVQQTSTPSSHHHLDSFPNNLEHFTAHSGGLNPDMVHVRNVRNSANLLYDPSMYSSEMLDFSRHNANVVLQAHRDHTESCQDLSVAPQHDHDQPHNFGNWRGFHNNQQQSLDWVLMNYAGSSVGSESGQNQMFVREETNVNPTSTHHHLKPSFSGYHQDLQSTLSNPSAEISHQVGQKHLGGVNMHLSSATPLYHNTLEDVITASARNHQGIENGHGSSSWSGGVGNELVLLPNYAHQSSWMDRPVENHHHWSSGQLGFNNTKKTSDEELRTVVSHDSNPQGLSLSLSSNPPSKLPATHFEGGSGSEDLHSTRTASTKADYVCSIPKPSIISKGGGKSLQDIVGISGNAYRNTGPLGPFTGYATILKSSKFLRPAQQLLEEFCCTSSSGSKRMEITCGLSERISEEVSVSASASADAMNAIESEVVGKGNNNSCASSSTFYGSNEISGDGGVGSTSSETFRPEYQQKKAKLLYMQEEVCRRYKQYHQQMQMVVSSFESVAGLSSATPYISLALKTVARHFRWLKNVIMDQLRCIRRALGEDLASPTTGTSSSKGETNTTRLKYMDQSFQKHKSSGVNVGFPEPQQHVWRPQRGLPERSVAILRAWLFEHFLHPYPTDTDKHMLATQTGLSRNQVSNWFINARVRVWKPMVEEIHSLETKGLAEVGQSHGKHDGNSAIEGSSRPSNIQISSNNPGTTSMMSNKQFECSLVGNIDGPSGEQRSNHEKRSRLECQVPTSMAGALAGFVPYQRGGLEVGGLGAVSLTLGLRHGVESAQQHNHHHQQQQQLRQQEDQLRRQLGGQMIHDFVG